MEMAKRWGDTLEQLRQCLPDDALKTLIERFGGQMLRIPKRLREPRAERIRRVIAALEKQTYPQAAVSTGIPERTLKRVAKLPDPTTEGSA